jgi:type III pantothenate kinase
MMLLAIDIGNTNVVIGIINEGKIIDQWRLTTSQNKTRDEFWVTTKLLAMNADIKTEDITQVIIGSVVPPLTNQFYLMAKKYLSKEAIIVRHDLPLEIDYLVDNPAELGADRICNIFAAREMYPLPQIVIDLGTATTFDIIDEASSYLGGSIMPGIETASFNLVDKAAKLPKFHLAFTESVIGKNTIQHLQAGVMWGAIDQIDGMVKRIISETGWQTPQVIATGGLAKVISRHSERITHVDSDLTLKGLWGICQKIHPRSG